MGREFEQAQGAGGGQGDMACCSPWGSSLHIMRAPKVKKSL